MKWWDTHHLVPKTVLQVCKSSLVFIRLVIQPRGVGTFQQIAGHVLRKSDMVERGKQRRVSIRSRPIQLLHSCDYKLLHSIRPHIPLEEKVITKTKGKD